MKKTIIKVGYSVRKEIMAALGVTYPTIRKALNERATPSWQKIRAAALAKVASS